MNCGDKSFLVRLDKGLEGVLNLDHGLAFDEARAAGMTQAEWVRQVHMHAWTKAPEEWELVRPIAWTPSDGVSLERYRRVCELVHARIYPIEDFEAYRVFLSSADRRDGCTQGDHVDELLFVRPLPRRWNWNYNHAGGWWLDTRRWRPRR